MGKSAKITSKFVDKGRGFGILVPDAMFHNGCGGLQTAGNHFLLGRLILDAAVSVMSSWAFLQLGPAKPSKLERY